MTLLGIFHCCVDGNVITNAIKNNENFNIVTFRNWIDSLIRVTARRPQRKQLDYGAWSKLYRLGYYVHYGCRCFRPRPWQFHV
jgi:hypothetical protein